MIRRIVLMIIIATASFSITHAQDYKTAVGIRLSSNDAAVNNSITFKHFITGNAALEAMLSFGDPLALGLLYELHKPVATSGLSWFYGGGAYVGFGGYRILGAQGVIGLDYKFATIPLNLSVDWKPEMNFIEHIAFEPATVGFSARFTLK